MSSSFRTLEEGMRIILYLLFLQEPLAFPTSCSLQLHWRWARRRPKSSARCLRRPGLGLTSPWRTRLQTEGGGWGGERELPGAPSSQPGFANLRILKGGGGLHALICASLQRCPFLFSSSLCKSLNLPVSDFLTLSPLFHEIPHLRHQMKGGRSARSVS